jgi:hypothetical protein
MWLIIRQALLLSAAVGKSRLGVIKLIYAKIETISLIDDFNCI